MAVKNVFSQFAGRTNFLNVGLALFSALFCIRFILGGKTAPAGAIIDPAIAFGVSAIVAAFGVMAPNANARSFNVFRDCLPVLVFSSALLLGGNQRSWVWVLFFISVAVTVFLLIFARDRGDYNEEDDRITINLRWPF